MMRWVLLLSALLVHGVHAATAPTTLDELVRSVRTATASELEAQEQREARFIAARNERRALLAAVREQRLAAEAEADRLRAEFERGENQLAELETQLDETSGDLREVFAVVHEIASSARWPSSADTRELSTSGSVSPAIS